MTDTSPVSYTLEGKIAHVRMDDGKANVMSERMLGALHAAFDRAEADQAVVLLTGRERTFSGGYDLAMFKRPPEEILRTLRAGGELVTRIASFAFPVIAACGGHAVAQGAFTLLAADVRFGTAGPFKIGLNEVAIGLTIPHYGVELARMRLSAPWFQHATITGALYSPEDAKQAGFLDAVYDSSELLERARAEAVRLSQLDMTAHVGTKLRVRGPALAKLREGIASELAG
ncbi:MAG: crotonase/enoyl-CoA hydratase family protein [Polyangiales bacterium]